MKQIYFGSTPISEPEKIAIVYPREETATNHSLKITAQSRANPTSWNPADPCWNRLESLRRDALVFGGRIILRYGGVGLSMPIFCGMKFAFKYPSRRNEGFRLIFVAFLNNTLPDSRKTPSSSVIPRNSPTPDITVSACGKPSLKLWKTIHCLWKACGIGGEKQTNCKVL